MSTEYLVTAELGTVRATSPAEARAIIERSLAGRVDVRLLRARKACAKCGRALPSHLLADDEDERCARCGDS